MLPNRNQLEQLSKFTYPCVSMYLPTHMAGADTRENAIRFKNRLQDAERQLQALGFDEDSAKDFLKDAYARVEDNTFWQHRQHGLAAFVSPEGFFEYDLPGNPKEFTVVASHAHVKPLLPYLTLDARFFVLAASLNRARLFEASRYYISEVTLPDDTPTSLAAALKYDDPETSLDHYTVSSGGNGNAVFQGQGAGKDDRNTNILRFFQALDNGVREMLEPHGARIPLVFAGDKGIFPIYQQANHYQGLLEEAVTGNPDEHDAKTLHEQAWQLLEPQLTEVFENAKAHYLQKANRDAEHASDVLREVLPAAFDSRVETLFVAQDKHIWGHYDHEKRQVEIHDDPQPGDDDLLDIMALQTLLTGGQVHVASQQQLPEQHPVAAVYRF